MTAVTVFSQDVDMTQWGSYLTDIGQAALTGGLTTHTASKIVIQSDTQKYTLGGSFTYSHGVPSGTITSLAVDTISGTHIVALSTFSITFAQLETFAQEADGAGFEQAILGGNDTFSVSGGTDKLKGFAGNDTFNLGSTLTTADSIDGGSGAHDTVILSGNYSNLVLGAHTLVNIEKIQLTAGTSYRITTHDGTVAAGKVLEVDCSGAGFGYALNFDGRAEKDGSFVVKGGNGNDTVFGGAKGDKIDGAQGHNTIIAGKGADTITVSLGNDTLVYSAANQSTKVNFDHIVSFDFNGNDHFNLGHSVHAIDSAVSGGALHKATFDADLGSAIGASQLHAGDAVLFTAGTGDYSGKTFLIVEAGGGAGYQAGSDYVFLLDNAQHLVNLDTSDFIS